MSSARSRGGVGSATPSQRAVQADKNGQSSGLQRNSHVAVAVPAPTLATPHLQQLATVLLCTVMLGTVISVYYVRPEVTAFRSRLPASQLTRWELGNKLAQQSDEAFPVPTLPYFADKRNLVNQLFVKNSWAWTTLAFVVHAATSYLDYPRAHPTAQRISLAGTSTFSVLMLQIRRYVLATLYWYYLTQRSWFGMSYPSVSKFILMRTGAQCVPSAMSSGASSSSDTRAFEEFANNHAAADVGAACIGAKGEYWRGGHDVSGHTFMMVHATLFLYQLIAPTLPLVFPSWYRRTSSETLPATAPLSIRLTTYFVMALMAIWWWMLLMTSLFFHSPAEKMSGFMFAVAGWFISNL